MWGPFCYFLLHGGGLFLGLPPPAKISAGAHDCKEGSRACSPKKYLCDRNLVSSGHVLLRFCLKNDKNNENCSHVPARWPVAHGFELEGMLIFFCGKCW